MKRLVILALAACAGLSGAVGATDNSSQGNAFYVSPDGVLQDDLIPATLGGLDNAGTPQWFVAQLQSRRSYVFEVVSRGMFQFNDPPQPAPTFFENDGATALAGVSLSEISYCDPKAGDFAQIPIRRYAIVNNTDTSKFMKIRVTSGLNYQTAEDQPFQVRLVDTTLASARWTTNTYNSFVALHNRSSCPLNYLITYYDEAGVQIGQASGALAGRGSVQVRKDATDPVFGSKRGSVEVQSSGAAGDLDGTVYVMSNALVVQFPLERRRYATP
jgi:hypothetical protein